MFRKSSSKSRALLSPTLLLVAPIVAIAQQPGSNDNGQVAPPQESNKNANTADETPPRPPLDLSTPRATMRTFLVAVQEATDKPERITDAIACLDLSQIPQEDVDVQSRDLALRLGTLIDKFGVNLDDIPVETKDEERFVFRTSGTKRLTDGTPAVISLQLDFDTNQWLFTPVTLTSIPLFEEELAEAATEKKEVDTKVPAARRTPRAAMKTFLDAMTADPKDLTAAVQCLNLSGIDAQIRDVRGKDLAHQLKFVMDRVKVVVLPEFPDTADGDPYVWYASEQGNIIIGKILEGDKALGEWRFTPETVAQLPAMYESLGAKPVIAELRATVAEEDLPLHLRLQRQLPPWAKEKHLYLQGWQWATLAALAVVGAVAKAIVSAIIIALVRAWFRRNRAEIEQHDLRRGLKWSGTVAMAVLWFYAVQYLQLPELLLTWLLPALKLLIVLSILGSLLRAVDVIGSFVATSKEVRLTQFDDLLVPFLRTVLRILVFVVLILFIVEMSGGKATTVLGALGIGGVAIAFAAQDTLGNFFGSITVLFDRPFGIGDWIAIGDVEGTVERVGFRSTRIRTFYNSVISIPNSKMTNTYVDNFGARRYRRVKAFLSLTYSTPPEKIDAFCEGIRELIRLHPYTRKDFYHVYFTRFNASSLDVLLYAFLQVPDWATELREQHRLFIDIMRLAQRLGVEFAFPTRTVWLERGRGPDGAAASSIPDPDVTGLEHAAGVFEEAYGREPSRRPPVVIDVEPRSRKLHRDGR